MTSSPSRPARRSGIASAASGASWLALLASTTLGIADLDAVKAHVTARDLGGDGEFRLIVQSYAPGSLSQGHLVPHARPLGSTQRAVTADEMAQGVSVQVVHLGEHEAQPVLVAWIERGTANLEYDGAQARPSGDALFGAASGRDARVVLGRKA